MKLLNPNYDEPPGSLAGVKSQIDAFFLANVSTKFVTFDQLRDAFNKSKTQWPDGVIHQQLIKWGYTVEV